MISMKDDPALGLRKNEPAKLIEVQEKLRKIMSERKLPVSNNGAVQAGGAGAETAVGSRKLALGTSIVTDISFLRLTTHASTLNRKGELL
jgi:hypothetical protein